MSDIYNLPNSPEKAIGGILRNGSKPGGIFSSAGFGNLKSTFGIGGTPKPPGFVGPVQTGTSFKSVMDSQGVHSAEAAGGAALFEAGAFGERRGTWAGVGETTAGGAAFGAQFGPWGAAIGAAAGFGVGIGEKLAGVESEREQSEAAGKADLQPQHRQQAGEADRGHRQIELTAMTWAWRSAATRCGNSCACGQRPWGTRRRW